MNKVNTMTIHDQKSGLPMTNDIISETQYMHVDPLRGDRLWVVLMRDDRGNKVELWKGTLWSTQLMEVLMTMQFLRVLAEGKDD